MARKKDEEKYGGLLRAPYDDPIDMEWVLTTPLYVLGMLAAFGLYVVCEHIWPQYAHLHMYMLLGGNGYSQHDYLHDVLAAWPVYIWAVLIAMIVRTKGARETGYTHPKQFWRGSYAAVVHAAMEEFIFRGMLLLTLPGLFLAVNPLTHDVLQNMTVKGLTPLANWLQYLSPMTWLGNGPMQFDPYPAGSWALVLAAVLLSFKFRNWRQRDWRSLLWNLNSWLLGSYMLHLVVSGSLLTAFTVHALYDLIRLWWLIWGSETKMPVTRPPAVAANLPEPADQ